MSFNNLDMESAMRRLAERRIEEAMREGKFDNLPGAGKPLELEPMPAEENARLMWWALRILKNHDVTPDEVRYRKQIDRLKDELEQATSEQRVVTLVTSINCLVRQVNTMGTNALKAAVAPVSLEAELRRLQERVAKAQEALTPPAPGTVGARKRATKHARCAAILCRAENPASAQFCRRCGRVISLTAAT